MTHDDWMHLLGPVLSALALGLAGVLGAIFTGLTARTAAYLDAKGNAAASQVLTDAAGRVQTAAANGAGRIALQIQTGALDITNVPAMKAAVEAEAVAVVAKLPTAIEIVQPIAGAVAGAIEGKITAALLAPAVAVPVLDTAVKVDGVPLVRSLATVLLVALGMSIAACTPVQVQTTLDDVRLFCATQGAVVALSTAAGTPILAQGQTKAYVDTACALAGGIAVSPPGAAVPTVTIPAVTVPL